jgi:ribonuclease J
LSIGDVKVKPVHVDHSVPGAYGFLIETSSGVVAYTGDLRAHGRRPDLTADFLKAAAASDPTALIIEGTRVCHSEKRLNHTESHVQTESFKLADSAKGLVLSMRYPKDLDRFFSFYTIAKETGRKLVISLKTAHLLTSLSTDHGIQLPDPWKDDSIAVYERKLSRYPAWQKPFLEKCVDAAYVQANAASLIFELDFYYFTELIDIKPSGGVCIHSMSEPFEEDPISVISDEVLDHWTNHYELTRHQLHASGHASKSEIMKMIADLHPKQVFPVHTHAPELFKESGAHVVVPIKDKKFEF